MHSYVVKVRGKAYLWGSSGLTVDLSWPLLLVINNDIIGDPIDVGSETALNEKQEYGTLQAGECWTIPLLGFRGIIATCTTDSAVTCTLLVPQLPLAQ